MKPIVTSTIICLGLASLAIAATTTAKRLTPRRITELTAPDDAAKPKAYKVEIAGLQKISPLLGHRGDAKVASLSVTLPAHKPEAIMEYIHELRFPSAFHPPTVNAKGDALAQPTRPAAFESVNTGWTIRLSAKQHGKIVALSGVAEYTEGEILSGGYGALGTPIHSEEGELLSPNVLHQPKFHTTTTHFQILALPGEPYEVTLYRGAKAEKHRVTLTTE